MCSQQLVAVLQRDGKTFISGSILLFFHHFSTDESSLHLRLVLSVVRSIAASLTFGLWAVFSMVTVLASDPELQGLQLGYALREAIAVLVTFLDFIFQHVTEPVEHSHL